MGTVCRVILPVIVALVGGLSACATETTSATEPLPTIGLGSGLDIGEEVEVDGSIAERADDIDSIVMIGDSITRGSTTQLAERFEALGLGDVTIEAQNGKRMVMSSGGNTGGAKVARFLAGSSDTADIWVVALGTNDIGQYAGPDEIAAAVDEVLAEVPDDAPLVWVDTYWADRAEDADVLNLVVRARIAERGNAVVAPWAAFAAAEGVLTGDGVHPTDDGADVFAFVVTDTVRSFLGR
jgi:lysophospholipase L1-like esterase